MKMLSDFFCQRVYEKLNEPINVAIAYDQFTEDQKTLKRSLNTSVGVCYLIVKKSRMPNVMYIYLFFIFRLNADPE
jgi:hypothetical protein